MRIVRVIKLDVQYSLPKPGDALVETINKALVVDNITHIQWLHNAGILTGVILSVGEKEDDDLGEPDLDDEENEDED